ncbi:putative ubiquitin-like-specific protease 1B [Carex rostrata]
MQKKAAIDLVEKHIPPSYKCPLRACDFWSISFLKYGLSGRMSEEIVAIGDARLTAKKMQCLIKSIDDDEIDKWIPDEVINCCIGIMNNQGSTLGKILIFSTFDSRLLESWGSSINEREKLHEHIIEKGKGFLQNELVFLPIYEQNHWFVGAFNASKKEFQILNSLNSEGATYEETTHKLRLGIQVCIDAALDYQGNPLDPWLQENIVSWPISVISNLPQQEDGCSCGLFALKYMKLWDGSKLATEFTQDDIDLFRKQLVGKLIFSDLNEKKDIQDEIKKRKFYT